MSDATRIANLEGSLADVAAYLDELRAALASHDAALGSQRLTELEQRISPSLAAPGVPATPGSVTGDSALAGLGSAYSTSVAMGAAGLFITDGALTVYNAGSTVVIDGTSNMFKIAASGTQEVAFPVATYTIAAATVTLTALGNGFSLPPATIWMMTWGATQDAAAYRGGPSHFEVSGANMLMALRSHTYLSSGYIVMLLVAMNLFSSYSGYNAYCRFHALKESGI
jgi:hypothetical protein